MMRALLLCLCLMPALVIAQGVTRIEVFSEGPVELSRLPYTKITHYDLTEPERVKRQLPRMNTKDERQAAANAKQWIESSEGQAFAERMRAAYDGHMKAMHYGLEKTPAIVFDRGEYVVYGSTDIRRALLIYRQQ